MRKLVVYYFIISMAVALNVQGAQIYSTLNTNSVAGDFHGTLNLYFSSTNSSDYSGGNWVPAYFSTTYTDSVSGAQIFLTFNVGPETSHELNLYPAFNFSDPRISNPQFSVPWPIFSPGYFVVGQSNTDNMAYSSGVVPLSDNSGGPPIGTLEFSYSLPVTFNGTTGSAVGSWALTYTITSAPEPGTGWLGVLGGLALLLARAKARMPRR